jgi:Tfp pilus assembly protein PilF
LAEVARRRNDGATAARMYDRVLENNPNYLPALMARGDQEWNAGNRAAALTFYKRVVEQGGGSGYGQRALARIAEQNGAAQDKPVPSEKAPAPSEKSADDKPEIDTSDLPGLK